MKKYTQRTFLFLILFSSFQARGISWSEVLLPQSVGSTVATVTTSLGALWIGINSFFSYKLKAVRVQNRHALDVMHEQTTRELAGNVGTVAALQMQQSQQTTTNTAILTAILVNQQNEKMKKTAQKKAEKDRKEHVEPRLSQHDGRLSSLEKSQGAMFMQLLALQQSMSQGFDKIGERFSHFEQRIGKVENHVGSLQKRIAPENFATCRSEVSERPITLQ